MIVTREWPVELKALTLWPFTESKHPVLCDWAVGVSGFTCNLCLPSLPLRPLPGPQHLLGFFSLHCTLIPVCFCKAGTSGNPGCGVQYNLPPQAPILSPELTSGHIETRGL